MNLTQSKLTCDLKKIGLQAGNVVLFHGSLSQLGHVHGGADTVIHALIEVVGPQGTVAAPNIVHTSGLPRAPFDIDQTPSEVGTLTEALRKHPDAIRSFHPTHSVAAVGRRAEELVQGHPDATGPWTPWGTDAFGIGSPWNRLVQWNACYLFLGVGFQVCTLFHYVQARYLAKHQPNYAQPIPFPYFSHVKMGKLLKNHLSLQPGTIGAAESWLLRAQDIVRITQRTLEYDPLSLAEEDRESSFINWANHVQGRSLALVGGMAYAKFNIPGRFSTHDGTDLKARALIIEGNGENFAIVSLTVICLSFQQQMYLRCQASEQTGIPVERIMIACTHVHSGPPMLSPDTGQIDRFMKQICQAMQAALRKAQDEMKPVRLAVATRSLNGLTRIRRARMNDGRVYSMRRAIPSTWRCEEKPEFLDIDGELDNDLTVIRIEDASQSTLGCLFHFTTHPIPDLHGYAADWIEQTLNSSFVCLPLNGALGDVDTPFDYPFHGRFSQEQLPFLGRVLSGALFELLGQAETKDDGNVQVVSTSIELAVDPLVTKNRSQDPIDWIAEAARRRKFEIDMMAVQLGPLALVGIPGELASSQGLRIKEASPFHPTCPVGLANAQVGYLMTQGSRDLGGYEADACQWALTASGSAEKVRNTAIELLKTL